MPIEQGSATVKSVRNKAAVVVLAAVLLVVEAALYASGDWLSGRVRGTAATVVLVVGCVLAVAVMVRSVERP